MVELKRALDAKGHCLLGEIQASALVLQSINQKVLVLQQILFAPKEDFSLLSPYRHQIPTILFSCNGMERLHGKNGSGCARFSCYNCYSDREAIPQWMPFISSVKILEDKPNLSRWSLKYKAFGSDIEFYWLA